MSSVNGCNKDIVLSLILKKLGFMLGIVPHPSRSFWTISYSCLYYMVLVTCAVFSFYTEIEGFWHLSDWCYSVIHLTMKIYFQTVGISSSITDRPHWQKLITNLNRFDEEMKNRIFFKDIKSPTHHISVSVFSLLVIVMVLSAYRITVILEDGPSATDIFSITYFILWKSQVFLLILQIYELTDLLKRRYEYLDNIIDATFNIKTEQVILKVAKLKQFSVFLSDMVTQLNGIYGKFIIWILMNSLVSLLLLWGKLMSLDANTFKKMVVFIILFFLHNLFQSGCFVVTIMSFDKVEKCGSLPIRTCCYREATVEDENIKRELVRLGQFVKELRPKFTASGFFSVNRTLLPAFLSVLTSYIIIIAQFKNA